MASTGGSFSFSASGTPTIPAPLTSSVQGIQASENGVRWVGSGPAAAFSFNEGTGATVTSTDGALTGTISGATWVDGGRFGKALSFDGINDMVTINATTALDLTSGMTLEAWVNPTSPSSGLSTILLKERAGGLDYALFASDGTARPPSAYIHVGGTDISAVGSSALPLNTWTHLAVTYDGSTLREYVNGTLVSSKSISGNILTSSGALRIGGNAIWGEYFAGLIDEVRIYGRALTQSEIQADMNTPVQ
jgi:hypothetical protein